MQFKLVMRIKINGDRARKKKSDRKYSINIQKKEKKIKGKTSEQRQI